MKYVLCFISGFMTCLLLGLSIFIYSKTHHPLGSIIYHGEGSITATEDDKTYEIDEKGRDLPYGMYQIKLKNGRTVSILKNNRGNVEIEEDSNTVLVYGDQNTIWATLEKK